jgi:imidazolonepropionase-like amidohydrolase
MSSMMISKLRPLALAPLVAGSILASSYAQPSNEGNLVIRPGKLVTMTGEVLEGATIVIENGRIKAIGTDVQAPHLFPVIQAPDLVAYPGFIEAISARGMDRGNENIDVAPFLDVRDSIDPVNFYFEDTLRAGITTINIQQGSDCVIGAQGHVVQPFGMTIEQMSVKPRAGIVLSADAKRGKSGATQAQALRKAFSDLRGHLEQLVEEQKEGNGRARREALYQGRDPQEVDQPGRAMQGKAWTVAGLELIPRAQIDAKMAPLLGLVEGKTPAFFYVTSPAQVRLALQVARENGFLEQTTLVLQSGAVYRAVDEIAAAGVHVVLPEQLLFTERHPVTGEETRVFVPKIFHDKGVRFALRSADASTQSLWYQAARCVANGVERQAALEAITLEPARILGLEGQLGTLEVGKAGNVVLFTGDPLKVTTRVQRVILAGNPVYDREADPRLRHLIEGREPPNTSAATDIDDDAPLSHQGE